MFTGIVVEQGEVVEVRHSDDGSDLSIRSSKLSSQLQVGDSVSINGACLTVVAVSDQTFRVEATPETLRLTNLGRLERGSRVNLEPSARISDFLSGHLVQGHVDEKGEVASVREEGNSWIFRFQASPHLLRYCALKGSIAVNGVSLTISGLGSEYFEVAIIPHTYQVTNFSQLRPGDEVNLEADIISKYVESHVRRLVGSLILLLGLSLGLAMGADLPLQPNTVLVFENSNAQKTNQFVVRVARGTPDLVMEWESVNDQGTVHLFQKAVLSSRSFTLMQLFEVGVDRESEDEMTLRLSRAVFEELLREKSAKIRLNRVPLKMEVVGEEIFTLTVDQEKRELMGVRVRDNRSGSWLFLNQADNPLVLEFKNPYFTQRLSRVSHPLRPSLRWLRRLPPIK